MDDIEQIKKRINIVDLINTYTPLKKAGKNIKGLCPFHKEKTPSFVVSEEMQRFKCFGCGKTGDIFNFIEEIERLDFNETLEFLAAKAGITLSKTTPKKNNTKQEKDLIFKANNLATSFFNSILVNHKLAENARKYLANRKITKETVKEFKLGYAPRSWDSLTKFAISKKAPKEILKKAGLVVAKKNGVDVYDLFRDRIMIPLVDPFNKIIGFSGRALNKEDMPKYVNTPETVVYHKQESLFGLNLTKNHIRQEGFAILVEGHFDLITPYQFGIKNIAATAGTALTDKQIDLLKKYTDTVVLLFDADGAGLDASLRGIDIIVAKGLNVKVGTIPKPYKDPDEMALSDIEGLKTVINEAVPLWDFYFFYINKKYNLDDIFQKKEAFRFIKSGILKITDPVIKSEYIEKASKFFNVAKVLLEVANMTNPVNSPHQSDQHNKPQVNQQSTIQSLNARKAENNALPAKSTPKSLTPVQKAQEYDRNFKIYLLALTFNIGYARIRDHLESIESSYFDDPDLEKIYEHYVSTASKLEPVNNLGNRSANTTNHENNRASSTLFKEIQSKYPEVTHILEEIYFCNDGILGQSKVDNLAENLLDEDSLKSEIIKSLRRLKRQYLSNKRNKLIENIKKAEVISDFKAIEEITKEVAKLQEEINPLQE